MQINIVLFDVSGQISLKETRAFIQDEEIQNILKILGWLSYKNTCINSSHDFYSKQIPGLYHAIQ